ncbi:hypothetical protein ACHHYP_17116 [Achlya hypogyna]|uniref:BZIP domain-containing protein n=1 Tax=Achlya hypogyna TaxID=1202772 RepID=A0A1V9Y554_ACHHY|nr:hypothetical protein ACHHYP_17116 [Achlya hypogyna]
MSQRKMTATQEAAIAERRRLHQLQRNRLKQRRHKARYISERKRLREQIEELSVAVAKRGPRTLLSWEDVARGLADAQFEATTTLQELRDKYSKMQATFVGALALATSLSRRSNVSTVAHEFAFSNVALVADRTARRLGMDWFTHHMYHYTDSILDYAGFPSAGRIGDSVVRSIGGDYADAMSRIQIEYDRPLEATYAALKDKIWSIWRGEPMPFYSEFLDHDTTAAIHATALYRRMVISEDESLYYIGREFRTPDRVVFVLGNFAQDAQLPYNARSMPCMFWLVLERSGPQQSRMRYVLYNGPMTQNGRPMTWQEESIVLEGLNQTYAAYEQSRILEVQPNLVEKMKELT